VTEKPVYFIDSTTFISAVDKDAESHRHCRELLDMVAKRQLEAVTSLETLEETLFILSRLIPRVDALRVVRNLMLLPGLSRYTIEYSTLMQAMEIMEIKPLRPKDAINVATMLENGIGLIVSEDRDYDGTGLVQRVHPRDVMGLE
jgi:predicted nucleic acid-binding protein